MSSAKKTVSKSVSCKLIGDPDVDRLEAPSDQIIDVINGRIYTLSRYVRLAYLATAILAVLVLAMFYAVSGKDTTAIMVLLVFEIPLVSCCLYLYPHKWNMWRQAWIITRDHMTLHKRFEPNRGPAIEQITDDEVHRFDYLFESNR